MNWRMWQRRVWLFRRGSIDDRPGRSSTAFCCSWNSFRRTGRRTIWVAFNRTRRRRTDFELERRQFGELRFLFAAFAIPADKVEVLALGLILFDPKALAVLPYIAILARNAMGAIVLYKLTAGQRGLACRSNLQYFLREHHSQNSRRPTRPLERDPPSSFAVSPVPT